MTESIGTLLEGAAELARLAGGTALGYYGRNLVVETKNDGSPVTIADRRAEEVAREWVARRFPEDDVLGEEFGTGSGGAKRRWIIDPIDGTKAFVRGVPLWGTLIAVADGERVLAGAAFFPAVDEVLCAALGEGCWWNDQQCFVSATADHGSATILTTDDRFLANPHRRAAWHSLASGVAVSRTWGDCYGYLLVATGRADVMVDDVVSPWDAAAFSPIIAEAGGVLTDWRGQSTPFGDGIVATNAALSRTVRVALGVPVQ